MRAALAKGWGVDRAAIPACLLDSPWMPRCSCVNRQACPGVADEDRGHDPNVGHNARTPMREWVAGVLCAGGRPLRAPIPDAQLHALPTQSGRLKLLHRWWAVTDPAEGWRVFNKHPAIAKDGSAAVANNEPLRCDQWSRRQTHCHSSSNRLCLATDELGLGDRADLRIGVGTQWLERPIVTCARRDDELKEFGTIVAVIT